MLIWNVTNLQDVIDMRQAVLFCFLFLEMKTSKL